jgi:thiol-disulfide isomerase/thioredoxin
MKKTFLLLWLAASLFGCKEATTHQQESPDKVVSEEVGTKTTAGLKIYDFAQLESQLLNKNNDSTYIVNFWATWCKPCVKELPYFEQVGLKYRDQKLKVILVSLDFPEHIQAKVIPFLEEKQLRSEVVLLDDTDANTWIPKVNANWQGSIPATLIFNARHREFFEKQLTFEELDEKIKSIL